MGKSNLKPLLGTAALFLLGWGLRQLSPQWMWVNAQHFWDDPAGMLLQYGVIALAAVTLIHGSWRVLPPMLLAAGVVEAVAWSLFYAGDWYYPGTDDYLFMIGLGCNFSALAGSRYLIARQRCAQCRFEKIANAVPRVVFTISLFFAGGYAWYLTMMAMDKFKPEAVAAISAMVCTLGLIAMKTIRPPQVSYIASATRSIRRIWTTAFGAT